MRAPRDMLAGESGVSQPLSATHGRAQINLFGRSTDGEAWVWVGTQAKRGHLELAEISPFRDASRW
jgi:hypothetical protein